MQLFTYLDYRPDIHQTCFLAPSVQIIGRFSAEENVNIWFNTVIRADVNFIKISANTNVQDLCMLHVTEKNPLIIGKNVTVGHSVILHGCKIEDHCLIGMGAKILDGAIIGEGSLVAAGSVVPPGKIYPSNSFIIGTPAKATRELTAKESMQVRNHYKAYVGYANEYKDTKKFRLISH